MTPAQERAIDELWPAYGIDFQTTPLDFDAIFKRDARRCLEIGFGVGEVIGSLAQSNPDIDYLGIEVHRSGVGRLLLRSRQDGLSNLRIICHDAVEVLSQQVADASFDEVLVFFPDPWHKKRHHKRRLIVPDFIALLAAKLRERGILRLATDWEPYAQQMLAVCNAQMSLETLSEDRTFVPRPHFRPATRFERRGARLGHGTWDLAFRKCGARSRSEETAANPLDDELHGERGEHHA